MLNIVLDAESDKSLNKLVQPLPELTLRSQNVYWSLMVS